MANFADLYALYSDASDTCSKQARSGDRLRVGVQLEATGPVDEDYVLFIHVLDSNGKLAMQSDSPALNGDWTTSALIPGVALGAERAIDLKDVRPGVYRVVLGLYSLPSLERLPVLDANDQPLPDGLIPLGTVEVR